MNSFFERIQWQPAIGDPTIMGWLTVLAYFIAFILSCRVVALSPHIFARQRQGQTRLWYFIALAMLLLCINKQLDLQSFFTAVARYFFKEYGLYHARREYQQLFIVSILILGMAMALGLVVALRRVIKKHWLALVGLLFLLLFVLVRAASFHHVDALIGYRIGGLKLNWVLELSGIACIAISALLLARRQYTVRIVKKYHGKR